MEGSVCPKSHQPLQPTALPLTAVSSVQSRHKLVTTGTACGLSWELCITIKLQVLSRGKCFTQFPTDSGSGSIPQQLWGVFRSTGSPKAAAGAWGLLPNHSTVKICTKVTMKNPLLSLHSVCQLLILIVKCYLGRSD